MAVHNVYFILKDSEKDNTKKRNKESPWHFLLNYVHSIKVPYEPETKQPGLIQSPIFNDQPIVNLFFKLINHSNLNINDIVLRMEQLSLLHIGSVAKIFFTTIGCIKR